MGNPVGVSGAPFPPSPQFLPPVAPVPVTAAPVLAARPLSVAARIAEVALWAIAAVELLIGAWWVSISSPDHFIQEGYARMPGDNLVNVLAVVNFLAQVTAAIAFVVWFHRAYKNVSALGAPWLRHGTGWAIGAWFVPIIAFFYPKRIANDIWRGSAPGRPVHGWTAWNAEAVPRWLDWWWVLWLAASVTAVLVGTVFSGPLTPSAYQTTAQLTAVGAWFGSGAAVLAALFVRRLTSRQERACMLARQALLHGRPPFPS